MSLLLSAHATLSTIAAAMKFSDLYLLSFVGFPKSEESGFPAFYPWFCLVHKSGTKNNIVTSDRQPKRDISFSPIFARRIRPDRASIEPRFSNTSN